MEKHVRLGLLLDIYGELLTERQRSILFQSVNEDCSLAEIAEREGVSRQAVRDAIMKATDNLEGYEAKLKLMERRMALMNGLEELQSICHDPAVKAKIRTLTEICEDGI